MGTTALQLAAANARAELDQYGVCYPGSDTSQHRAAYAFMRRPDPRGKSIPGALRRTGVGRVPPISEWHELTAEISAANVQRALISHESIARAAPNMARRFVRRLGRNRTHIAITVRPPVEALPSRWNELVKEGTTVPLDEWVAGALTDPARWLSRGMRRYIDLAGLVDRWASVAGTANVTVIVVDKSNRNIITDAFEQLLGLPAGMLAAAAPDGAINRSMTVPEAEVIRTINVCVRRATALRRSRLVRAFRTSVINRAVDNRMPLLAEPRMALSAHAAKLAADCGYEHARQIAESGVRVIGDLSALHRQPAEPPVQPAEPARTGLSSSQAVVAMQLLAGATRGGAQHIIETLRWHLG